MSRLEQYILYLLVLWHYRAKMVRYKVLYKTYVVMSGKVLKLAKTIDSVQADVADMQCNLLEMQSRLMDSDNNG